MSNDRLNDCTRWDELGTPPWLHHNSSQLRSAQEQKLPKNLGLFGRSSHHLG